LRRCRGVFPTSLIHCQRITQAPPVTVWRSESGLSLGVTTRRRIHVGRSLTPLAGSAAYARSFSPRARAARLAYGRPAHVRN
jgi:hypothetical protein